MIKVCLVGYGGIARAHKSGYRSEIEAKGLGEFCGAFEINPDRFERRVTTNLAEDTPKEVVDFRTYTDLDTMLETEKPDVVTVALPTYLHKDMTIKILKKGYNVLCEKPMALNSAECEEMIAAAKETGKKLMVGQCLRFAPEYEFLKDAIDTGKFGKVRSVFMERLSTAPIWGWENWYMDTAKSGGALQDLHIHDIDMARYLFGEPEKISCISKAGYSDYESAFSQLFYKDFVASIIGDWSLINHPFKPGYRIAFEKATVTWDYNELWVYPCDAAKYKVDLPAVNPYGAEAAFFGKVVTEGAQNTKNTPESAAATIKLIEALRQSADNGGAILEYDV